VTEQPPAPSSAHIDDQLVDAALRTLSPAAHAAVTAHVRTCARCRERFAAVKEALAEVSLGLPPTAPPARLRDNILAGTLGSRAATPYPGFVARLSRMYQLDAGQMLDVLRKSADPAQWEDQGLVSLLHFPAGASLPSAHAGFMRLAVGLRFPRHRHVGHELTLVLEGTIKDEDSGTIYHPGDSLRMEAGSEHAFFVLPPKDCVLALLLEQSWPQFTGG